MARFVKFACGSYELEIPANPYPGYPHVERLNYVATKASSGRLMAVDNGPTKVSNELVWKFLSHSTAKAFETFFLLRTQLALKPFSMVCPDYFDLGNGIGVNVASAQYDGTESFKDLITPRDGAGLYYDLKLPYTFTR